MIYLNMTEQLIDTDIIDSSPKLNPTIWDIENAEKLQFVAFIQEKMEENFSKKFDYYEQLLLSLQEEHSKQILKLSNELQYAKHKLEETTQHLCYLQELQEAQVTNLLNELEYSKDKLKEQNIYIRVNERSKSKYLPNYRSGFLVYKKCDACIYCDKLYPQLKELPNLTELKLDFWINIDKLILENVKKVEVVWNTSFHLKQDMINYPHAQYSVNEETYRQYIKTNNFNTFPNLEQLIITLDNRNNVGGNTCIRVAQNIIEVIEFNPCKIREITIILNKNPNCLFTGNLEPLKTFCVKNNIQCIIN